MLVLRIEVSGHAAEVRWPGTEVVLGTGDAAAIVRDDAGWADREAVLVHLADHALVVPTDGRPPTRLRVGESVRLGSAEVTLIGLSPATGGPASAQAPNSVATASTLGAAPPDLDLPIELDKPGAVEPPRPRTPRDPAGPRVEEAPTAAQAIGTAATTKMATTTAARPDRTSPFASSSFDEELYGILRRSPWWILSAAVHGLLLLVLSLLAPAAPPRPDAIVVHGMLFSEELREQPLDSGGPLEPALPDLPLEPPEAPDADLPLLPLHDAPFEATPDSAPPLPYEPEVETPPAPWETALGLHHDTPRVRRDPAPAPVPREGDADLLVDDPERAKAMNAKAAARVRAEIAKGAGPLGKALKGLRTDDILVVRGSFDHMQNTLEELGLPFTMKAPFDLPGYALSRHKVVFWNCGENLLRPHEQERVLKSVREFVQGGGYLFTTDWALTNLVMPAFPGYLRTKGRLSPMPELIVDIVPTRAAGSHRLLDGVFAEGERPRWWLEQASFDIEVVRKESVEVLIEAPALGDEPHRRSTAVAVTFHVGRGRVLHLLGHYYQQKGNVSGAVGAQRLPLNFVRMRLEGATTGD